MGIDGNDNIGGMTATPDSPYSKRDLERLIHQIVPPIVETTVNSAMSRVQATLATDIAKGVAQALNEQNAKLGIDTTSAAGIKEAQRRNLHVDNWIEARATTALRHQQVDELLRDFTDEDRQWVKITRKRTESDARTIRESVIRWAVVAMLGAMGALVAIWWREDRSKVASMPMPVIEADRGRVVVRHPTPAN